MQSTTQISTPHININQNNSDMPELAFIPLVKLDIHPQNVRKTPLSAREQDEITASIGHQGLVEPLVCIPAANTPDSYLVIAGGRRLTSLHMLDEANKLPSSLQHGIPCQIFPEDVDVTLLSMTENHIRFSMNPADQIVAWRDLFANGYGIDDIASRFGQHPKLVQQRLKLSNLIPEVIDLLRDGDITLKIAGTFSLIGDASAQKAALSSFDDPADINDYQIRRLINRNKYTMADIRAQIVGLQSYMSAGGTYIEDLFTDRDDGSQIMLADPDILDDLFEAKCADIEADLLGEGWQWVELVEGHYSSTFYNTIEMSVAEAQPTEEEAARLDEIINIFTKEKASQALSNAEIRDLERENQELVNLTEARRFTAEDRARSGVVVRFCHNYAAYHYGRIKPKAETHKSKSSITPNMDDPQSLYSGALTSDIASIRTDIIRGTLLAHPRLCLDMLAFKMASSILNNYTDICNIELGRQMSPDFDNRPMADRFQTFFDSMNRNWARYEDSYERFRAFQAMDATDKDRWITWAVITSFSTGVASGDQTSADEAVISMLTIDWADHWRADETFWKRVSKPAMTEMLSPVLGATWFGNRSGFTKNEMAKLLGDVCTGNSNQVTATQGEAIRNWQISGLAPIGQRNATEVTETNATTASDPNLDQPDKQDQADAAFTVKKARLIPLKADHGGIAWTTEEIPSDEAHNSLSATAEYAHVSQSASNAITDAEIIKDKLGAKPGTEKAEMIDAMADKITVIDMMAPAMPSAESSSAPNPVTYNQETQSQVENNPDNTDCPSGKPAMPDTTKDELELPDFLKRN